MLQALNAMTNLEEVIRFLAPAGFPLAKMDSVAHDEFTLDLVVPFPAGPRHLVIGIT